MGLKGSTIKMDPKRKRAVATRHSAMIYSPRIMKECKGLVKRGKWDYSLYQVKNVHP